MRAADLEAFHNCKGRYTVGRGQANITFCSDDEDADSNLEVESDEGNVQNIGKGNPKDLRCFPTAFPKSTDIRQWLNLIAQSIANASAYIDNKPTSDCESGSTEKCANERGHPYPMFERQGSFINRERMIAHSTALESITINVDPTAASSHPGCADDDEGKKLSLIMGTTQGDY